MLAMLASTILWLWRAGGPGSTPPTAQESSVPISLVVLPFSGAAAEGEDFLADQLPHYSRALELQARLATLRPLDHSSLRGDQGVQRNQPTGGDLGGHQHQRAELQGSGKDRRLADSWGRDLRRQ